MDLMDGDCVLMSECGVNEFGQIETDEQGNCLNPLDFCTVVID